MVAMKTGLRLVVCLGLCVMQAAVPARAEMASAQNTDMGTVLTKTVQDAFDAGDFRTAARQARKGLGAEAAAMAARANLAEGDFIAPAGARRALFVEAERDARLALERDPENIEGHLYLALALGFLGRIDGTLKAHFGGYADEARNHIDKALALDPGNAWAHALDGGWNLEITRNGGALGEAIYDASFEKGVAAYREALTLEPENSAIAYQFALQLLAAGGKSNRDEAYRVVARSLAPRDETMVERMARRRAQRLKLALDTDDRLALRDILREGLGTNRDVTRQGLTPGHR